MNLTAPRVPRDACAGTGPFQTPRLPARREGFSQCAEIRNQQVTRSSRVVGSTIRNNNTSCDQCVSRYPDAG